VPAPAWADENYRKFWQFGLAGFHDFCCALGLEDLDRRMDKEIQMKAASGQEDHKREYTTPAYVQAWFLKRSRDNWKRKYMQVKGGDKRLQNRVRDVTKSREQWREQSKEWQQRLQELEAENAALQQQLAALKKDGQRAATGRLR
jgi:chromosome segregation ATPase